MAKFRLNRRAVLRGAGSIAIALPWLEIMEPEGPAYGASTPAQRFLSVYTPGGTVRAKWIPTGTETAPVLSPILAPLQPMMDAKKLIIVDKLNMTSAVGEQHQSGIIALLTGTQQGAAGKYSAGPSIDQVLATRLYAQKTRAQRSIEIAVRWATGKSHGLLSPINSLNFEDSAQHSPISPRLDPQQIWTDIFGNVKPASSTGTVDSSIMDRKKSILDFIDKKYAALSPRLGAADKQKIDQHLTKIREVENSLTAVVSATCTPPVKVDTTGYNPRTGINSADDGSVKDISTDSMIPKVGMLMMDMMVMAMACDITAVGTLQWSDTEAKHTFPWLNLSEHHHFYQHDGGYRPVECQQIYTWYSTMHLYLLQAMNAVDMGGHTLLDESVVFIGSELQEPPTHLKGNLPLLVAGGGGGLRGGRWVQNNGESHNNLLVSILNLFGDTRTTFGDPKFCTGPLNNLT